MTTEWPDVESMIAACVPGDSICDPKVVADNLRAYFARYEPELWRALSDLLDHVDAETCTHESTHRGGAIWTICDNCHAKWADDRGGFKSHEDAPAVAAARAIISAGRDSVTESDLERMAPLPASTPAGAVADTIGFHSFDPGDRFFHAADETWWRSENGRLVRADAPAEDTNDAVRRLIGRIDTYRMRMSYNDSYFGEPAGLLKGVFAELSRLVNPIYPSGKTPMVAAAD